MELNNLPNGWREASWNEVVKIINGKNQKDVQSEDGAYPIYGSGGVIGKATEYLCEAGTTIIGRKGTINNPILVEEPFWNVDTAFGICPSEYVLPKYLYYFCLLFNFKSLDKSTTIPSLAKRDLLTIKMPLAPIEEQEVLIRKVEELLSELDKGVAELQKANVQLRLFSSSILKDAFSNHASFDNLSNHADMCLGKMLDKNKNVGEYQAYIRNQNVRWFHFNMSDLLYMRITKDEHDRYSIQKGDLVICEGGEPGRCAIWENNNSVFFQKALHRVRVKDTLDSYFLMYYLWYMTLTGQLEQHFTGTTIKHLTGRELKKIPVPILRKEQQIEIVRRLKANLSICSEVEQEISESLQKAETLRQSILKQAFEGKLV